MWVSLTKFSILGTKSPIEIMKLFLILHNITNDYLIYEITIAGINYCHKRNSYVYILL